MALARRDQMNLFKVKTNWHQIKRGGKPAKRTHSHTRAHIKRLINWSKAKLAHTHTLCISQCGQMRSFKGNKKACQLHENAIKVIYYMKIISMLKENGQKSQSIGTHLSSSSSGKYARHKPDRLNNKHTALTVKPRSSLCTEKPLRFPLLNKKEEENKTIDKYTLFVGPHFKEHTAPLLYAC